MKLAVALIGLATFVQSALAVAEWGQCGGLTYTGSTTCDAGLTCVYSNDWYSQCLRVSTTTSSSRTSTTTSRTSTTTTTTRSSTTTTTTRTSSTTTSRTSTSTSPTASSGTCTGVTKFKYYGVNESCAEFGNANIPGVLGTDYTWPSPSSIDYFMGKGMNTFRVAFLMERLSPPANGLTGAFDSTYLSGLKTIVSYITNKGGYAIIDPHNFARYNGAVITDTSAFQTWWKNLAAQFSGNSNVIFDINNEPYGITATAAAALNQAGINGIRSTGAGNLILVEGTSWSGAWTWTSSGNSDAYTSLSDPMNNFAIEMHQYLDSDGSGTSETCVSSTIGVERLQAATAWLKANNLKGFLGEIGAGSNDACIAAVKGALCHMQQAGGVWIGALWWAAGPWWGTYFQSIEPPSGASIARILPEALLPYV
ncbi:putative cellulase precursor [Serendipita vermifera]|nr:putative cellulase precursor [Serendipita vermifera]